MITSLVNALSSLPPLLIVVIAALLPAAEASALLGLVVPGETAVFVAGMNAHAGRLPLWAAMAAGALGAVAGDQIGFAIGRRWGPGLVDRLPRNLGRSSKVQGALRLVQRRGGWAVVIGRWTAVLRALVPGLAGASGMPRRTFTVANVVGGVVWAVVVAALGYGAGAAYQKVIATMGRAGEIGVGLLVAAGLIAWVIGRVRRRRDDRPGRPGPNLDRDPA